MQYFVFSRCFPLILHTEKTKSLGLSSDVGHLVAEFAWRVCASGPGLPSSTAYTSICLPLRNC